VKLWVIGVVLLVSAGCYRVGPPPDVAESVRVVIVANDARLVRGQASLQSEVAEALTQRLGWHVDPTGSARLDISLAREDQNETAGDRRGIPARWSITLHGTTKLRTRDGEIAHAWRGVGHASGLNDEAAALDQAAHNGAAEIAAWLQSTVPELRK
jgi:hypothetical protein